MRLMVSSSYFNRSSYSAQIATSPFAKIDIFVDIRCVEGEISGEEKLVKQGRRQNRDVLEE